MKLIAKSFFVLLLSSSTCLGQSNYFVSPTGNNSNLGTLNAPWKTIQYGIGKLANNDTLNVLTGTYTEKIQFSKSSIYVRSHKANTPIVDATGITTQNPIVKITNKSNVTLDGFELKNNIQTDAQGILVDGAGTNITIKNCIVHDIHFSSNVNAAVNANTNAQGIIVYGSNATTAITNLKIINNQLYNCRLGYSEGIAVNGNVDGFQVSNNLVYNLTNIGIDIIGHEGTSSNAANDQARNGIVKGNTIHHCISAYATSGGLYVDGGKNIVFEGNSSYHNGYGIEVGCENVGTTTDGIIVRNNIFYDNQVCAIAFGGYDFPNGSGKVTNSSILNNTCYFNDYSNSGNGELYLSYSETSKIENNIFFTTTKNKLVYAELTQPQLSFNYNNVYCAAGKGSLSADWNGNSYSNYTAFQTGTSTNANSIFVNPLFLNPSISTPDFRVSAGSACLNMGNPAYVLGLNEMDFYNQPRILNGRIDLGAIELPITTNTIDAITTVQDIVLYPNPAMDFVTLNVAEELGTIQVFNVAGQFVLETCATNKIDVSCLDTGIYIIRIEFDGRIILKKLIKM